ncbi:hypothetical protein HMPREF9406_2926 [Clostridium sp. HGF2]|nr:hypothetical protein HMPREF9406_2926 [Clostridium sp. HGF2]EQJ49385.1 hypothetical protein QSI_4621 [Clostridioides difficile P28]
MFIISCFIRFGAGNRMVLYVNITSEIKKSDSFLLSDT